MRTEDYLHPSDNDDFSMLKEEDTILTRHSLVDLRSRQFPKGHDIHLHYHDTLEIDISKGARGTIMIDGEKISIEPGIVIVIPPGILHAYHFEPESHDFEVLHISLETFSTYVHKEKVFGVLDDGFQHIPWVHESYSEIVPLVDELSSMDESDILSMLAAILKICSYLIRPEETRLRSRDPNEQIRRVIEFTEANCHHPISVEDAAGVAGLSRSFFSRKFKAYTGTTYSSYLTQVRLSHAKHLLLQGYQVTESCLESGFENLSYFIEIFKRHNHGLSPGRFQRTYLEYGRKQRSSDESTETKR